MFSKRIFILLVKQIRLELFLRISDENIVSSKIFNCNADMVAEMEKFTSHQIMVEASTVMRPQAIKSSLNVLKLLGPVSFIIIYKKNRLY